MLLYLESFLYIDWPSYYVRMSIKFPIRDQFQARVVYYGRSKFGPAIEPPLGPTRLSIRHLPHDPETYFADGIVVDAIDKKHG